MWVGEISVAVQTPPAPFKFAIFPQTPKPRGLPALGIATTPRHRVWWWRGRDWTLSIRSSGVLPAAP